MKDSILYDELEGSVRVAEPPLRDSGSAGSFHRPIATGGVFEDNVLVREALQTKGQRRVLVVDGGGSTRCALLGTGSRGTLTKTAGPG